MYITTTDVTDHSFLLPVGLSAASDQAPVQRDSSFLSCLQLKLFLRNWPESPLHCTRYSSMIHYDVLRGTPSVRLSVLDGKW